MFYIDQSIFVLTGIKILCWSQLEIFLFPKKGKMNVPDLISGAVHKTSKTIAMNAQA